MSPTELLNVVKQSLQKEFGLALEAIGLTNQIPDGEYKVEIFDELITVQVVFGKIVFPIPEHWIR